MENKESQLKRYWDRYSEETLFNFSILADFLEVHGQLVSFKAGEVIVFRGDFPTDIFFIKDGVCIGMRDYEDGSEYTYFQVDQTNGDIGLLEILARQEAYIATVTCLTTVKAIKVPAYLVYERIMKDSSLLRRCSVLLAQDLYKRSGNDGFLYRFHGIDRLRYYLINYYEEHCPSSQAFIVVNKHYQDIANELGVSIRTIGRSLKELKDEQEIVGKNRKILLDEKCYLLMKKNFVKFLV